MEAGSEHYPPHLPEGLRHQLCLSKCSSMGIRVLVQGDPDRFSYTSSFPVT